MNAATLVTSARIVLSPVFFFIFILSVKGGTAPAGALAALWAVFAAIEISDFFDGRIARNTGSVTDLGKVLDPFADSFARLTYFLSFLVAGIMPPWAFVVVLYRDLGISFVRLLFMGKGVAMGAKLSGKVKAVVYAIAGLAGMGLVTASSAASAGWSGWVAELLPACRAVAEAFWWACVAVAVWTMIDYAVAYRRHAAKR
jgi:CDP-diacylglycerol---glycerol-3-phosphate 3-phosphatidyltransferase